MLLQSGPPVCAKCSNCKAVGGRPCFHPRLVLKVLRKKSSAEDWQSWAKEMAWHTAGSRCTPVAFARAH